MRARRKHSGSTPSDEDADQLRGDVLRLLHADGRPPAHKASGREKGDGLGWRRWSSST